ncbi:NADPH-dependent FMN reductase [Bacillus cihuensis]|uniref:NADPH-dependent FMN reductase n=1 Tax=Bacillus cihuensis TaxID=1208599 RepID=UPI000418F72C|nr:NADPH-dependent FMN reductase [Bacillus cihuensis]
MLIRTKDNYYFTKKEGQQMPNVVILSGSPSAPSRTDFVLKFVQSLLEKENITVTYVSVLDIPAEDLHNARYNSSEIKAIAKSIEEADGVIIGSPVYKASYTGVLKSLIDLIPEGAFKGIPVLPIMVGGSKAHLLAIDFALKPLITTLKGRATQGTYIIDNQIDKENSLQPITDQDIQARLNNDLEEFLQIIKQTKAITS